MFLFKIVWFFTRLFFRAAFTFCICLFTVVYGQDAMHFIRDKAGDFREQMSDLNTDTMVVAMRKKLVNVIDPADDRNSRHSSERRF